MVRSTDRTKTKHVGHDFQDPLVHIHSKVEGTNEYALLLYVPSRAPFDMWDRDAKQENRENRVRSCNQSSFAWYSFTVRLTVE